MFILVAMYLNKYEKEENHIKRMRTKLCFKSLSLLVFNLNKSTLDMITMEMMNSCSILVPFKYLVFQLRVLPNTRHDSFDMIIYFTPETCGSIHLI